VKTNSKIIGNNYEREFCKKLSNWLTGKKYADVCWRDIGSGARYTIRKKTGKETARKGDIVCTDLKYQWFFDLFYIDCKSLKSANFFFINPNNQKSNHVLKEWKKVLSDCPPNMLPMMAVKIRDKKTPEFLIFREATWLKTTMSMDFHLENCRFFIIAQNEFFSENFAKDFYANNAR